MPVSAPMTDDYHQHLNQVNMMNVVIYDTDAKRAWLVDGASATLHITCTYAHGYDVLRVLSSDGPNTISGFCFELQDYHREVY